MPPLLLPLVLLAPQVLPAPPQADPATAIRVEDLRARIGFLADDALEGRESGQRGGRAAAQYFANQWRRLGLQGIGEDGSYLLPFAVGPLECWNTAGLLPGTDPAYDDQILVLGGHHDHAGIGGPGAMGFPGEIHNGADDNASGSAGVAELAEWFVAHPLRRPILFMTFSAEERGLLGSAAFVRSGTIPAERMFAMINLDMIGRSTDDYLFIGGLGTATELHELLDPVLERAAHFRLERKDEGEAPSDNTSFFHAGVPALFFFTDIHEDYHMPSDDADKINYEGERRILELVRDCAVALDQHDGRLEFVDRRGDALPDGFMRRNMDHMRAAFERQRQRGKLGVQAEESEAGLLVAAVTDGGAAMAAGVRAGDVLVRVGERAVATKEDLRRALGGKLKGDRIGLELRRDGAVLSLALTLQ